MNGAVLKDPPPRPWGSVTSAVTAADESLGHEADRDNLLGDEPPILSTTASCADPSLPQRDRLAHDFRVLRRQVRALEDTEMWMAEIRNGRHRLSSTSGAASPSLQEVRRQSETETGPHSPTFVGAQPGFHSGIGNHLDIRTLSSSQPPKSRTQVGDQLINAIVNGSWTLAHKVEQNQLEQAACHDHCSENHVVRRYCIRVANSWWFDQAVLLLIIIGSLLMVLDAPGLYERDPELKKFIAVCDEVLLYIFTLEMVIKVEAMGVVFGPKTYLRDNWNKLDALVIASGWFSVLTNQFGECQIPGLLFCSETSGGSGFSFGVLRTIRILRPLRAINQLPTMKHLVQTLFQSLPELLEMGVLCAFILVLFGIIGVQLYMGVLRQQCSGGATAGGADAMSLCSLNGEGFGSGARCPSGSTCLQDAGENPNDGVTSFDNLPTAILALFQSITLEGWVDIMYQIRKVKGLHHDLYFITLILFGSLFMTNLVVGVLIQKVTQASNATREQNEINQNMSHLSTAATRVITASTTTFRGSSTRSSQPSWLRMQCELVINSPRFSVGVMVLILLNTAVLALDNVIHPQVLEYLNYVFTGIFFAEMVLKTLGLTFCVYCRDMFNVFDFVIVCFSILEIVLAKTINVNGPSTTILRTFRLLRVFKLARSMKSLGKILDALLGSLHAIVNLFWLLLLFMFVCALMGMNLFGVAETQAQGETGDGPPKWDFEEEGMYTGRMVRPNFSTFLNSMATVFILITGENWNEIMYIAVKHNGEYSALYFVFVIIAGNYIVLNLFLAVLVDKFDTGQRDDDDRSERYLGGSNRAIDRPVGRSCCSWVFNLRLRLWWVIRHPYFDNFIYGLIAVSAVNLVMDAPNVKDPESKRMFFVLDMVLSGLFVFETVCKIFVYGFLWSPTAYLRDSWNILDFFVVVTSILNTLLQNTSLINTEVVWLSWLKGLRALRALRPLRMVSRSEGMKAVVGAIFKAVPAMFDVLLVLALFLLIFSILGVQLLKNKMWMCSCQDDCPEKRFNPAGLFGDRPAEYLCQGTCPLSTGGSSNCVWQRDPNWSFDNILVSGLTLFEVASLEMWPDIMWRAVDGTSQDEGPQYNQNKVVMLFFILYIFVMSFFILNLFVGVVIDKFSDVRNEMNGLAVMTPAQRRWIATQRLLLAARPRPLILPPESRWRQLALQLVSTKEFEAAILGMIVANIAMMCTNSYAATSGLETMQENANTVFLVMFTFEAAIKLFALSRRFFIDPWNVFDLIIVAGGLVSAASSGAQEAGWLDPTLLRTFRIARIFRLVKSLRSLRKFFETLLMSLSSLVDVGALLLLLFFVYAVAGMALFGDIQIEGNPKLSMMNEDANFGSFYVAMIMLFRISTGESWNGLMHDCFTGARCAEPPHEEACGNTVIAILFFVSFMLVGSFVFLNLFIAVIIEKLFDLELTSDMEDEAAEYGKSTIGITAEDVENFIVEWSRLVQNGDYYMPTAKLGMFLTKVDPPMGFRGEAMVTHRQLQLMTRLGIMDHGGCVHFAEVLWRMASMVAGADMSNVADYELMRSLHKRVLKALPTPNTKAGSVVYLAAHVNASLKLQSRWRARQVRQKLLSTTSAMEEGNHEESEMGPRGSRAAVASVLMGHSFSVSKAGDSKENSKVSFLRLTSRKRSESFGNKKLGEDWASGTGSQSMATASGALLAEAPTITPVAEPSATHGACAAPAPPAFSSPVATMSSVSAAGGGHGGVPDVRPSQAFHGWSLQESTFLAEAKGAAAPAVPVAASGYATEHSEVNILEPAAVEPRRTTMEGFLMACTSAVAVTESPTASRRRSAEPPLIEAWSGAWREGDVPVRPGPDEGYSCGGCGERFCVQAPATEDDRITLVVQKADRSPTETCTL